jgi:hypothetical protein
MKTSRFSRFLAAIVVMLSMLYMQFAVASYVCPGVPAGSNGSAASAQVVMADMPNCQGMDAARPALCHLYAHGEPSKQSLDKTPAPDVPPFVPAALVLDIWVSELIVVPAFQFYPQIALTRTSAPPIAIRNCCFRI